MSKVVVDGRFNGPPDSGNGGYVCGVLGSAIAGPAISTLRKPPPLGRELDLRIGADGQVELIDGEQPIGTAVPRELTIDVPEAPSFDAAVEASKRFPGFDFHAFGTCFVCGADRPNDDGMKLYAGPVENQPIVACPWTPDASMPNDEGRVADEIVWAALDCPSYFVFFPAPAVLGRLHADLRREIRVGERYIVTAWEIGQEGRKHWSGCAVYDEDRVPCAVGSATWILLDDSQQQDFRLGG